MGAVFDLSKRGALFGAIFRTTLHARFNLFQYIWRHLFK